MAKLQCDICGGKLMAKSGGIYECEFCGVQYDTEWAKAKIQEIRGTVQVEGTVEVKGTVTVDTQSEKANLLKRIAICAEDKDFDKIKKLTEQLLSLEPECGDAYLWQLVCKYKCCTQDGLFKLLLPELKSIEESSEWKNALRYVDSNRSEELKARMDSAIDYWKKDDPELKRRFDKIQPVQNLIYSFNGGIIALQSDGTVRATYTEKGKWLSAVEQWTGIKKLYTDNTYGYVIGLRWDGTIVAAYNSAKTQKIIKDLLGWANGDTKVVDMCTYGSFIVCLFEDGVVASTKDQFDEDDTFYFGYAEDWNDVESLQTICVSESGVCEEFWGEEIYGLEAYMILGITKDGNVRCSASGYDLGSKQIENILKVSYWEKMQKVAKIDTIHEKVLHRDGTISSYGYRDRNKKWLDFDISDKGCIMKTSELVDERFSERNIVSNADYCALRSDGTVVRADIRKVPSLGCAVSQDIEQWTNIVALKCDYLGKDCSCVLGLREDGKVLISWFDKSIPEISVEDWKLFDSLKTFEQERKATQKRIEEEAEAKRIAEAKAKAEAERKAELERIAKEQEMQEKRNRGVCQHCGGEFKGLFIKKCTKCGLPKDY